MPDDNITRYRASGAPVIEVYDVFVHHFGEDKVDITFPEEPSEEAEIQITVYFPEVKVTNEYENSVIIYDLYARIYLKQDGTMLRQFELIRTTFPQKQFIVGYTHSHVPPSALGTWATSCLGKGPIKNTVHALISGNTTIEIWMLFCRELSEYVQVESLSGGPFIRMERIGEKGYPIEFVYHNHRPVTHYSHHYIMQSCGTNSDELFKELLVYILEQNVLKYRWSNGRYFIAHNGLEFNMLITKCILRYAAEHNISKEQLQTDLIDYATPENGVLYAVQKRSSIRINQFEGREILTFKGEVKTGHIIADDESQTARLVPYTKDAYALEFHRLINIIINFAYGKADKFEEGVCYL